MTSYMDAMGHELKSTKANEDCHKGSLPLPKANIAPEKRPSQKEGSLPTINFQEL